MTTPNISANDKLIKNLEAQLNRLMEELKDLEECRNDISTEEYNVMRDETIEQIKEFTETLDRMIKGDVSINSQLSTMKETLRKAISNSFNTLEIMKVFGAQNNDELNKKLIQLDKEYKAKNITFNEMELQKITILSKWREQGYSLSDDDKYFLECKSQELLERIETE